MFEYRWVEVSVGDGEDPTLSSLGAEGWDAVGMTATGQHFGNTWVRVLLKRPSQVAAPHLVDVSTYERRQGDRRQYHATG